MSERPQTPPDRARLEKVVEEAGGQLRRTIERWPPERPAPIWTEGGRWHRPETMWTDWTPGFLAGQLWILHRLTGDRWWRERAQEYTEKLAPRRFDR